MLARLEFNQRGTMYIHSKFVFNILYGALMYSSALEGTMMGLLVDTTLHDALVWKKIGIS